MISRKSLALGTATAMAAGLISLGAAASAGAADQGQTRVAQKRVVVYKDARYKGQTRTIKSNRANLKGYAWPNGSNMNDSISSAINTGKRTVTFYKNKNYRGAHFSLARNDREAHFGNRGLPDLTSSIKFR